jgi:hypothetical protein
MLSWAPTRSLSAAASPSPSPSPPPSRRACAGARSRWAVRHSEAAAPHVHKPRGLLATSSDGGCRLCGPSIKVPRWATPGLAGPHSTRRLRNRVSLSLHFDFVCSWQSKHQAPASCGACTTTRLPPAPAPIKQPNLSPRHPLVAVVTIAYLHLSPTRPRSVGSPVRFGQRTERVAHLQRTKALHSH